MELRFRRLATQPAREISALRKLVVSFPPSVIAPDSCRPVEERRNHRRHRVLERAWFDGEARAVYTRLHDISRGGLSVRGAMPFQDGERLTVTLRGVRAHAEVSWRSDRAPAGMGFRFVEVLDGEDELLELTRGPLLY